VAAALAVCALVLAAATEMVPVFAFPLAPHAVVMVEL
jgi:hypothetical protein